MFQNYIDAGWRLCRIEPGSKGPRYTGWNEAHNALLTAQGVKAAGLMHSYSGTCAFDIDDLSATVARIPEVADWFLDPSMVRIDSGRPNRAKFLFALPEPLPSKSFGAFELRCATSGGKTVQDVLPPSPHPSGTTYKWVGDWRQLPALPETLKALWLDVQKSADVHETRIPDVSELEALLSKRDPSCGYDEWLKIGMVVHHETNGEGFALWDRWSSKGKNYKGTEDLRSHWQSFGRSDHPVTIDTLRKNDVATACKHWRNLLAVADRLGRPLSEYRADVEDLIEHHNCK